MIQKNSFLITSYHPMQPSTKYLCKDAEYMEYKPDNRLTPFLYYYWEYKTTTALAAPLHYGITPNGCMEIYFELSTPEKSLATGCGSSFNEVVLNNEFHYIGICFLPTVFPLLYNVKASELSDKHFESSFVAPQTAKFIARYINKDLTINKIIQLLDTHFLSLVANAAIHTDNRVLDALDIIIKDAGNTAIMSDIKTGLSARQLRRLFDFYVGCSPKAFSKVVRFQAFLQQNSNIKQAIANFDYFDFGYYDQAHFIKEFKILYGATPGMAFGR